MFNNFIKISFKLLDLFFNEYEACIDFLAVSTIIFLIIIAIVLIWQDIEYKQREKDLD